MFTNSYKKKIQEHKEMPFRNQTFILKKLELWYPKSLNFHFAGNEADLINENMNKRTDSPILSPSSPPQDVPLPKCMLNATRGGKLWKTDA